MKTIRFFLAFAVSVTPLVARAEGPAGSEDDRFARDGYFRVVAGAGRAVQVPLDDNNASSTLSFEIGHYPLGGALGTGFSHVVDGGFKGYWSVVTPGIFAALDLTYLMMSGFWRSPPEPHYFRLRLGARLGLGISQSTTPIVYGNLGPTAPAYVLARPELEPFFDVEVLCPKHREYAAFIRASADTGVNLVEMYRWSVALGLSYGFDVAGSGEMKRFSWALVSAFALPLLVLTCQSNPPDPPACMTIAPIEGIFDAGTTDVVWGFADLHAHPAIERAFGGRLIWGGAIDNAPVNATQLPEITPCPVETHDPNAASPIEREVGTLIFPHLAGEAMFAHAPVGDLTYRPSTAWPNARDVIHQQMNVSSIRRAYEGGLRLMFASATDDQVVSALLQGPNMINAFVPDPNADYASARQQLEFIEDIVHRNAKWMDIANTPARARQIIGQGKLAIVLSLEMNGLTQCQVDTLVHDFGVVHIIPIHLIDNDVGGTAATADIFNASSALQSPLYRTNQHSDQYINVVGTPRYLRPLGWPVEIATLEPAPLFGTIQPISYAQYSALCYEPLNACAGFAPPPDPSFIELGTENSLGLCNDLCPPGGGEARIRHFIDSKLFVDLSHMGARATDDTLRIDAGRPFPYIASHGNISYPESPGSDNERDLSADAGAQVIAQGGVLGAGTGLGLYGARTVFEARGGPLMTFDPSNGNTSGCAEGSDASVGGDCEPAIAVSTQDPGPISVLQVRTVGGISDVTLNAHPYVRVELDGPDGGGYQRQVIVEPMICSTQECTATVTLGAQHNPVAPPTGDAGGCSTPTATPSSTPYTLDDLEVVNLEWLYLGCDLACEEDAGAVGTNQQCQSGWSSSEAPAWTINEAVLTAVNAADASTPIASVGPRYPKPISVLTQGRGQLTLFQNSDRPSPKVHASGHLLRISMTTGTENALTGASASSAGANVCAAFRVLENGICTAAPAPPSGAIECPSGWWPINQRGAWATGGVLYAFGHYAGSDSAICGVDVTVLDWASTNPVWTLDEVNVAAIEDPVSNWMFSYARAASEVAGSQAGRIAFGTDFNGLNGLIEISENSVPAGSLSASFCPAMGDDTAPLDAGPTTLAPMRLLHADGTLGDPVLIEERGLATYGLLADMMAIIRANPNTTCGRSVYDSLMLSAEATIRAWDAIENPDAAPASMPLLPFDCGAGEDAVSDAAPDGGGRRLSPGGPVEAGAMP